jgi:DNA-binding MarR family transcriptional regulator
VSSPGCDPSNVTFLVNRLARRRLVSRARASRDRRVKALTLTPAGVKARNRLIATIAESPIFSQLTHTQRRQLAGSSGAASAPTAQTRIARLSQRSDSQLQHAANLRPHACVKRRPAGRMASHAAASTKASAVPRPWSHSGTRIHPMSDESIAARIESLVAEEHELRNREQQDSASTEALEADQQRLGEVEVELDRCWDLLRQRRALRDAGGDPEQAQARDANTVERYLQ